MKRFLSAAFAALTAVSAAWCAEWTTKVEFYSPSIVRVLKYPGEKAPATLSYPIVLKPGKAATTTKGSTVSSSSISVTENADGSLTFATPDGQVLLRESGYQFAPASSEADKGKYRVTQNFQLDPKEAIFGLGQRNSTAMNQRGQQVRFWSGNTNITIPYIASQKGYGLYWDNPGDGSFADSESATSFTAEVAPAIDYYFIYDDGSLDGVMKSVRQLSGEAKMFPLWTLGYWQSRERYKSSDELCDVLDNYRRLRVPLDGIIQDWQYWGCDSNWNAMRFMNPHYINKMGDEKWMRYLPNDEDPATRYPQPRIKSPKEMVDYVHANNAHIMISIWASFGPWTDQFAELAKENALLPFETWPHNRGVRPYDPFNPKARDIYWKHLRNLYDMGIDAWWSDSTEPDHVEKPGDADHLTFDGSWRSVKNAFPLITNKGIYENQRRMKPNGKRAFQMTRCGAFGLQNYAAFSWSGDIIANWQTMKAQVPSGLNYVVCGIPFWNTDLGGFFLWEYNNDIKNPAMQELQVRWMQWGTFMPLMRNHCSGPALNEIYNFGKPGEWAFDCQKQAIHLRYRLLPYTYSMMGNVVRNAGSMMRPLVMDFPADTTAINDNRAYMFGPAFLVSPVTDPLYTFLDSDRKGHEIYPDITKGAAPVEVYLPQGAKWYDFWTNELLDGGRSLLRPTPISEMPVYVRAGSIVPFGPEVQYSNEKPWDNLEVRVYPGADCHFTLYEDEGDGYNYEKGEFSEIPMSWNDSTRTLTIGKRQGSFNGMLQTRKFRLTLVDTSTPGGSIPATATKTVDYHGTPLSVSL